MDTHWKFIRPEDRKGGAIPCRLVVTAAIFIPVPLYQDKSSFDVCPALNETSRIKKKPGKNAFLYDLHS